MISQTIQSHDQTNSKALDHSSSTDPYQTNNKDTDQTNSRDPEIQVRQTTQTQLKLLLKELPGHCLQHLLFRDLHCLSFRELYNKTNNLKTTVFIWL